MSAPHPYAPRPYARVPSSLRRGLVFAPDLISVEDPITGKRGTLDGTTLVVDGDYRALNGTTDRIDFGLAAGSMPNLAGSACSFAVWVNFDALAHTSRLFSPYLDATNGALFFAALTTGALLFFRTTDGTSMTRTSGASMVTTGAWAHIAVASPAGLTAASTLIYVDGAEVGSYGTTTNGTGTERATTYSWSIGGRLHLDDNNVDGSMRQPMVWDRVLSEAEFAALAALPRPA